MKTNLLATTSASVLAYCSLLSTSAFAVTGNDTIPAKPTGELSATPEVVVAGTRPFLSWNIDYPQKVYNPDSSGGDGGSQTSGSAGTGTSGSTEPVATSEVNGTSGSGGIIAAQTDSTSIQLDDTLYVSVTPIGTGVTACVPGQESSQIYAEARISVNGGSFQQLFYGALADVDASHILYAKQLAAGSTIDFGGRYVKSGAWSPFYTTKSNGMQVITLKNGDVPPTTFSFSGYSELKSYLQPYFDGTGRVKLGPMSFLVMMELGQTDQSQSCFDYQDMVLLVTLSKKHPNNGHGNNLDGVDSSNPGKGSGGPNGAIDPSGSYDDEMK